MDLQSLLNDSGPRKPPPTRSLSIQEQLVQTPTRGNVADWAQESSSKDRSASHPPHLQPVDSRATGPGYFAQTPYHNNSASASTWSATHSQYSQSPGTHPPPHTPHDGFPQTPYNQVFVPSPSPFSHHPQTPGAVAYPPSQPHPPSQNTTPVTPSSYTSGHTREPSHGPNGTINALSPRTTTKYHPQPVAPLAPPPQLQRPASQSVRPPSREFEHYRKYSSGSIGSAHSREAGPGYLTSPQQLRRGSLQRQYTMERERSVSVSPKTVPQPSPLRQLSSGSRRQSFIATMMQPQVKAESGFAPMMEKSELHTNPYQSTFTATSASQTPQEESISHHTESPSSSYQAAAVQMSTPTYSNAPLATLQSPQNGKPISLKRNASVVSSKSPTTQPPRKRLRRDEIPLYAQSARPPDRPVRLHKGSSLGARIHAAASRSNAAANGASASPAAASHASATEPLPTQPLDDKWESSIMNVVPHEDLTRRVCDWIVQTIGLATPPSGGAAFEIEAKVGAIIDNDTRERINLPVATEAIFNKDLWRGTHFESTLQMANHKQINEFLNKLVQESQAPSREPIAYSHPNESDEFFGLDRTGIENLPPSITQWLNPRQTPRVRKTFDFKTHQIREQIIKSRIADMDVYNPGSDFDYRISINIESPWDGNPEWLKSLPEEDASRSKDRVSYRHFAYQIDLTQVTIPNKPKLHELEVEISTVMIRQHLDNLRQGRPSRYEELVKGFVDNVRILCRQASIQRKR